MAIKVTTAFNINCHSGRSSKANADEDTTPNMSAPTTVPATEPNPPFILVPPSKVTTSALNSYPAPLVEIAAFVSDASSIPVMPASSALIIYNIDICFSTLIPESRAASWFAPIR